MNIEILFTEQRWNILNSLSKGSYSPLQLANLSNTTMANISQQLRLLEISNLVKKEKISNRDKGKPRTLFSLQDDNAYLILAMNGFAGKKLVKLDKFHKILFRTWFLDNNELKQFVEKFIWGIEDNIKNIDLIAVTANEKGVNVLIGSVNPKNVKVKDINIKIGSISKNFKINIVSLDEVKKISKLKKGIFSSISEVQIIYDESGIITNLSGDNNE